MSSCTSKSNTGLTGTQKYPAIRLTGSDPVSECCKLINSKGDGTQGVIVSGKCWFHDKDAPQKNAANQTLVMPPSPPPPPCTSQSNTGLTGTQKYPAIRLTGSDPVSECCKLINSKGDGTIGVIASGKCWFHDKDAPQKNIANQTLVMPPSPPPPPCTSKSNTGLTGTQKYPAIRLTGSDPVSECCKLINSKGDGTLGVIASGKCWFHDKDAPQKNIANQTLVMPSGPGPTPTPTPKPTPPAGKCPTQKASCDGDVWTLTGSDGKTYTTAKCIDKETCVVSAASEPHAADGTTHPDANQASDLCPDTPEGSGCKLNHHDCAASGKSCTYDLTVEKPWCLASTTKIPKLVNGNIQHVELDELNDGDMIRTTRGDYPISHIMKTHTIGAHTYVKVEKGSLGENTPSQDLYLTKEHSFSLGYYKNSVLNRNIHDPEQDDMVYLHITADQLADKLPGITRVQKEFDAMFNLVFDEHVSLDIYGLEVMMHHPVGNPYTLPEEKYQDKSKINNKVQKPLFTHYGMLENVKPEHMEMKDFLRNCITANLEDKFRLEDVNHPSFAPQKTMISEDMREKLRVA